MTNGRPDLPPRNPRHLRRLLTLLLPLLALRALLPAGYMPVAEDGALRIVMCSGAAWAPHTTDGEDSGGPRDPGDPGPCAFAQSAMQAPPPAPTLFMASVSLQRLVPAPAAALPPPTGPPRRSLARAPPRIS